MAISKSAEVHQIVTSVSEGNIEVVAGEHRRLRQMKTTLSGFESMDIFLGDPDTGAPAYGPDFGGATVLVAAPKGRLNLGGGAVLP